jgi:diguanylate cyclase (GGDEF)-like protein
MQHIGLLTALFETVLVYDESGRVLHRAGTPIDIENVLEDERLAPLRVRLADSLGNIPFEAYFAIGGQERNRWRGVPYATEAGHKAAILAIEGGYGNVSRTRLAGSEFDFVLANMRQGFLRRTAKGAIAYANEYIASLLELTSDELAGRHISEFMPGVQDREGRYEAEFVTQSGIRRRAIVSTAPLSTAKGRISGYIDVITDITAEHALRTRLVAEVQKMSRLAHTDALTGLANRMEFQMELDRLMQLDPAEPFGLVMVDLDQFKEVNDQYGHSAGDDVLVEFSMRLRQAVRDSDLAARLGGDEFAILLSGAPREIAAEVVERLIGRLRFTVAIGTEFVPICASVGWAHSDDGPESIFQSADRRMYRDKRKKRGP